MDCNQLVVLYEKEQYDEIAKIENDPLNSFSDDPFALQLFGAVYFKLGNFSKSFSLLENLESILGTDVSYLSLFAATCRRLGQFSKAEALFLKALKIQPDSIETKNNYANLLIDLGKYQQAIDLLNVIIQSNPNYHDAVNNLERASNLLTTSSQNANDDSSVPADKSWSLPDPLMLSFDGNEIGVNSFLNNSHQEKDSHK